jgi:hypothetical protein
MLGVNAAYPLTNNLTGTLVVVNGYWHLADANNVPSSGGQLAYKANGWTIRQTVLYGPHQSDTSLEFWRFLSDSIAEWKSGRLTTAFEYQFANEKVAGTESQRAQWTSAQLPVHWAFNDQWSATIRPEFASDHSGRWTGFAQSVKAMTSTVEYRVPHGKTSAILRLEHRFDDSRGPDGGFFHDGFSGPDVVELKPRQHLLIFAAIVTFDSPIGH